jgi:hypothetical protein
MNSLRISAFEIHKCIHVSLHLEEQEVLSKQTAGQIGNDELNIRNLRRVLLYTSNKESLKDNYEVSRAWTEIHSSR